MGDQEWTMQRNWKHWVHKTQDEDKQNKNKTQHNTMCVGHHQHTFMTICSFRWNIYRGYEASEHFYRLSWLVLSLLLEFLD